MKSVLIAAAALACAASSAHASIIPTLQSVTDNGDGTWTYDYQATLAGDTGLVNGSKFVIVDFGGYVAGSIASPVAGFLASVENTTSLLLTQPGSTDDPTIENLVFTWVGGAFQNAGGPFPAVNFDHFTARSISSRLDQSYFTAKSVTNNRPAVAGQPAYNVGYVAVPAPVPEPATWAMMILGFVGVGAMARRRRPIGLAAA